MAQCSPDNNNVAAAQNTDARPHRKLFECDVCNMKFSNGANMRRHKMRHTGVKPYECRVCQKRFFRKDHLAEHFTTHTKSLPYHCPICNRGFQRQIAMRAHFQNEHVGQHDLVKTCPLCSYRAPTMKSLRVHFFNRSLFLTLTFISGFHYLSNTRNHSILLQVITFPTDTVLIWTTQGPVTTLFPFSRPA